MLLYAAAFLLRNRFKRQLAYMLILLFLWTEAHIVLTNDVLDGTASPGDELGRSMALRSRYEYLMRAAAFFSIFGTPSLAFACAYVFLYCGFITWLSLLKGDWSKPQFKETLSQQPVYVMLCVVAFYMLQKRELKRFFQEQKAVRKERQVSDVLNAQSDAIVVIQSHEQAAAEADREAGHLGSGILKFLFSNSKSVRLFGFNLMVPDTSSAPADKDAG